MPNLQELTQMPAQARADYAGYFTHAMAVVFRVAAVIASIGFALSWLLPERPLRETLAATTGDVGEELGQAMAMARPVAAEEELLRGLAAVMDRDLRRHHVGLVVQRAGLTLPPEAAWLLLRLNEAPHARLADLQPVSPFTLEDLERGAQALAGKGLVLREPSGRWELTRDGCASLEKVVQARRKHLEALFAEWSPQHQSDLAELLRRLGPQILPAARQVA
jgi:hypothetical protein